MAIKKKIIKLSTEKEVEVKALPLKKYADLIAKLESIPTLLSAFDGKEVDEILSTLPTVVANCYIDVVTILEIGSPLSREEIDNDEFTLEDAIDILTAIVEVNNYSEVYKKVKKMMGARG